MNGSQVTLQRVELVLVESRCELFLLTLNAYWSVVILVCLSSTKIREELPLRKQCTAGVQSLTNDCSCIFLFEHYFWDPLALLQVFFLALRAKSGQKSPK